MRIVGGLVAKVSSAKFERGKTYLHPVTGAVYIAAVYCNYYYLVNLEDGGMRCSPLGSKDQIEAYMQNEHMTEIPAVVQIP